MPQFSPGESKTAIAPIVAKPSGMDCEAELFLGPDDATKVGSSGRVPFVSTGATKNVNLPITLPSSPGTYHGYIDVFAEGLRFLAYKLTEDVVITSPELLLCPGWPLTIDPEHKVIAVTGVGGKKFKEVGKGFTILFGASTQGWNIPVFFPDLQYAVLTEPIRVSKLSGLSVAFRNVSIYFSIGNKGLIFFLGYLPTWSIDTMQESVTQVVCSGPPAFRGQRVYWPGIQGVEIFSDTIDVGGEYAPGWSCPGTYHVIFGWGILSEYGEWSGGERFLIPNAVECSAEVGPDW